MGVYERGVADVGYSCKAECGTIGVSFFGDMEKSVEVQRGLEVSWCWGLRGGRGNFPRRRKQQ